jgi:AbrB family looped-hinge helix DNA binding protein
MSIVKIQRKGQMTLPADVREAVGLAHGDLVDVRVVGRKTHYARSGD